jgi:hypothetical protein
MVTPFYVTISYSLEDAQGNLTGDVDEFTMYASDTAIPLKVGTAAGNSFVFMRGNARVTDIVSDAAATMLVMSLVVNNVPRNIKVRLNSCLGANLKRVPMPIRLAQGAMVEWVQSAT